MPFVAPIDDAAIQLEQCELSLDALPKQTVDRNLFSEAVTGLLVG